MPARRVPCVMKLKAMSMVVSDSHQRERVNRARNITRTVPATTETEPTSMLNVIVLRPLPGDKGPKLGSLRWVVGSVCSFESARETLSTRLLSHSILLMWDVQNPKTDDATSNAILEVSTRREKTKSLHPRNIRKRERVHQNRAKTADTTP